MQPVASADRTSASAGISVGDMVGIEDIVSRIWAEVLDLEEVTPTDDFFDLGGDSLSAIQILSRIQQRLQIKVAEGEFFTARTVAGLCQLIKRAKQLGQDSSHALKACGPTESHPASSAQKRLWVLDQFIANREVYNIPFLIHIAGELDAEALRRAFEYVEARHDPLRSRFEVIDGEPQVRIARPSRVDLPVIDLRGLPYEQRMERVLRDASADAKTPFDLQSERLWYARLYRIANDASFLWTLTHHTIIDGWSYGVWFRELELAYDAYRSGREPDSAPLPIRYADYAQWQRNWQQSAAYREQLEHWRNVLTPPLGTLTFPFSKPRPRVQTFRGTIHTFAFPRKLINAIDRLSRQESVTRFMIGLAAFQALLYRYTGQEDVLIGTPVANRNRPELEPLIGFFVNTLILRTNLGDQPSFHALLDRVRKVRLDAFTHQDVPLESLIEELQPPRDTSRQPFFQVVFQYQNVDIIPERLGRHKLTVHRIHNQTAMFDLRMVLEHGPYDSLWAWIEYNTDLFDSVYIEQFARNYLTFLEAAVANPAQKIDQYPLLNAEERQRIVFDWNATKGAYPADQCIQDGFEEQARRQPDATAVVTGKATYTYQQINARANQLARLLREHGIQRGDHVGICLKRSAEQIAAVLAVLKAGAAYVPLDAAYPRDRLGFMIRDTAAPRVLTQTDLLDRLPEGITTYLCIDQLSATLEKLATENLEKQSEPDDRAYVIYTSGSTGQPKGVMVRHRPVCNVLDWVNQTFKVSPDDRLLFVTSLSFDLSVYDIFGVLGAGGSLRIASEEELRDPAALLEILQREPITLWDSAPAALQQLTPFFPSEVFQTATLRLVLLSGDWIPVTLPDAVRNVFPRARVISLGGATEATIWSNWYPIEEVNPSWPSIPYGKPIRNARYHILDRNLLPVVPGIPGELYIGGPVLADGYLNRAELTAERFIRDPFAPPEEPTARLYKTGDLARYLPDGNIEFLGRIDTQVKVRGFRVEAGEIETLLSQHPAVQTAIIRPHKDASQQIVLIAFVVLRSGQQADEASLRDHLLTKVPDYMVPAYFVFRDAMPLTPNGKIDRAALQPPRLEALESRRGYETPTDPIEVRLAEIWREILGVEQVGRCDHFFELGGHSLRGAHLLARINEAFQTQLRLPLLFEKPVLAAMAECIRSAMGESAASLDVVPRRDDLGDHVPLSLTQQRFVLFDRVIGKREVYNVNDRYRIIGSVDVAALREAWQAVVSRHESLRTIIVEAEQEICQQILPSVQGELEFVDLRSSPGKLDEAIRRDAETPFDLCTPPLWRVKLYQINESDFVLHTNIHHLLIDESSRPILLRDLWRAYEAILARRPLRWTPQPLRYRDFAVWQRERAASAETGLHLSYWIEKLRDPAAPVCPPHPNRRPLQRDHAGLLHRFELPASLSKEVATLGRQLGVSPFTIYLTAFQVLLSRYAGQSDVCVGTAVSHRPVGKGADIVGCFVNTVAIRTRCPRELTFREWVADVRQTLTEAFANGDVSLEAILEAIRLQRIPGSHPLFQTMFVYQNEELHGQATGLHWELLQTDHVGSKFDFTLTIEERPGRLAACIEAAADLYDLPSLARSATHYQTLLQSIVAAPDQPILELNLLSSAEREQLLYGWNPIPSRVSPPSLLDTLAERVARTPNLVAFQHRHAVLTFAEWNARANQLAAYLRDRGVGPDVVVTVCLERSLAMPIALLAIHKTGGAYAPLDPAHPTDRLSYMIADTRCRLVVTQRSVVDRLPGDSGVEYLLMEECTRTLTGYSEEDIEVSATDRDLFAVIYTSGSTGRPKGVALERRGVANLLAAMQPHLPLEAGDRCLAVSTYAFDIHILDFWWAPLQAATVGIADRPTAMDGKAIAEAIAATGATVMSATPATWRLLLEAGWTGAPRMKAICGGEAITADLAREMVPRVAQFWNIYGPTETTVFSVWHRVTDVEHAPPVGRPIANTRIYLLDEKQQPVPIGCPGEVYIAGAGVGRGYFQQAELTAQRFLYDPFAAVAEQTNEPPERMYRTGDLGRYRVDGTIEILGRIDFQVKIRGFRIELPEIEHVLEQHPAIRTAIVIMRKNASGLDTLYAYFTASSDISPSPSELRAYLLQKLPDYMIPAAFTRLESFRYTPNGKIDRQALPEPATEAHPVATRTYVEPVNDPERHLQPIWEEVFGIHPISVTDDFHELGGHSLLAAQLMSRIETQLGHRIPLEVLFERPTIRGLAQLIQTRLELGREALVPLQTGRSSVPLFLIAGAGGHVFAFHHFARQLGPQYNVYGLKAIGVDGSEPPLQSIPEIASRYLAEITAAEPKGPYVLGGYSIGGLIAFELAQQLQQAGHRVSRLIIFDLLAPGYPKLLSLRQRLVLHARHFWRVSWKNKWAYVKERFSHLYRRFCRGKDRFDVDNEALSGLDVIPQARFRQVWAGLLKARAEYWPAERFDGKIVLVSSSIPLDWVGFVFDDPLKGWSQWTTQPVKLYEVPARHMELFREDNLALLTSQIRDVMDEAGQDTEPEVAPIRGYPIVA